MKTIQLGKNGQETAEQIGFKEGDEVAGIYFTGIISSLPQEGDDMRFHMVQIKDSDKRIDGKFVAMSQMELRYGNVPHFQREYFEYQQSLSSDAPTERDATYGELRVGLNIDKTGVDQFPEVYTIKKQCANIIDEALHQLRLRQKEMSILSQEPTNKISASLASAELYKTAEKIAIELKYILVSAAIGNNDHAS